MAQDTLENLVNKQGTKDVRQKRITLEDRIANVVKETKAAYQYFKTPFNYSLLTAAGYLSYGFSGLAGPVTGASMMLGKILVNIKKGVRTKWNSLYREGFKGIILGNLAKAFYQHVISAIPNKTIYGKIGRALAYNPGFIGSVYNPVYLKTTHVLDGKKPEQGEWYNLTKKIFKYNGPFHYLTTNYIGNVQQQVAASALLGTAYRVIAG